jgi:hypothetical protein
MIPGCEIKDNSVCLVGVQAAMARAAIVVARMYRQRGFTAIITSGVDGTHSAKSLHYQGLALDFRTRTVPVAARQPLRDAIADALGSDFDVVLEKDHLHVEFDPDGAP